MKITRALPIFLVTLCYAIPVLSKGSSANNIEIIADRMYSGILGNAQSFDFNLAPKEGMLFSVSQPNANAVVVAFSLDSTSDPVTLFESSIPDTGWLDEVVFVTAAHCHRCRIQVRPASPADAFGNFELTTKLIPDFQTQPESKIFELWTQLASQWYEAGDSPTKLQEVLAIYDKASDLAKKKNLPRAALRSRYLATRILHRLNDYSAQKQELESLLQLTDIENSMLYALIIWDLADIAIIDNQLNDANHYTNTLANIAEVKDDPLLQATRFSAEASVANATGQFKIAEKLFDQVNDIYLATGNWRKSVEAQTSQGWFQYRRGELDAAMQNYKNALVIATRSGLQELQIDLNTKIASIYRMKAEVNRATQYIDVAISISQSQPQSRAVGWSLQEKARIYMVAGHWELARDVLDESKIVFQTINSERDVSNINYFLAGVSLELQDFEQAKLYLNQVLEYDLARDSQYDIGIGYSRLSDAALAQNKLKQALKYQEKALDYLAKTDDHFILGRLYNQAGKVFFKNEAYEKSAQYFEKANKIQQDIQDRFGQIETGFQQALMLQGIGDNEQAMKILSNVIEQVRQERQNMSSGDLKKNFLAIQQDVISLQIAIMGNTGSEPRQTLMLSDAFRSQTLADRFASMHSEERAAPQLLQKRKALEMKLQRGVVNYQTLSNNDNRIAIVKQARKTVAELHALDAEIESTKPTHKTVSSFKREVNISQIQRSLSDSSVVMYFDTSPEESHLWVISHKDIRYHRLPPKKQLQKPITQLLSLLSNKPVRNRRTDKLNPLIDEISRLLFKDTDIAWESLERLIIIPDGPLNYLPFSVVTLPGQKTPFLEKLNLTYAPSLSVLLQLQNKTRNTETNGEILIVANPTLQDQSNDKRDIPAGLRAGFSSHELPFTQKELEAIQNAASVKTHVLDRQTASKHNFLALPLGQFSIMHFATHGLANNYVPSLGGLVFSNTDSADNLLLAPEIANLELNAELVVLSACETGYGRLIEGEGLQGLSRAFFEAGTQRVIASLWSVQDDATAALMAAFYKYLLKFNKPAEEALRMAKLDVKNHRRKNRQRPWRDPFYWAGFVLQGPGGKISGR